MKDFKNTTELAKFIFNKTIRGKVTSFEISVLLDEFSKAHNFNREVLFEEVRGIHDEMIINHLIDITGMSEYDVRKLLCLQDDRLLNLPENARKIFLIMSLPLFY